MQRSDFRFLDRLRVRWVEIDAQKIVFNAHYLMYFDTAMTGYWRALALPYAETMASLQGDLFVRKAEIDYRASARMDDLLDIGLRCERIGNASIVFVGGAFRQDKLLVSCQLTYVFAEADGSASKPVPAELRQALERFEAGEPVLEVRVGNWQSVGGDAAVLREDVFVIEQNIPADLEWDGADDDAVHAVTFNRLGSAVGTGRMLVHEPGVARIGRMAVRGGLRGSGVGRAVLDALLDAARNRGDWQALLHAQSAAVSFYERAGFVKEGEPFDEAGIAHQTMVRML